MKFYELDSGMKVYDCSMLVLSAGYWLSDLSDIERTHFGWSSSKYGLCIILLF